MRIELKDGSELNIRSKAIVKSTAKIREDIIIAVRLLNDFAGLRTMIGMAVNMDIKGNKIKEIIKFSMYCTFPIKWLRRDTSRISKNKAG